VSRTAGYTHAESIGADAQLQGCIPRRGTRLVNLDSLPWSQFRVNSEEERETIPPSHDLVPPSCSKNLPTPRRRRCGPRARIHLVGLRQGLVR
jgi:hypothetical protein